MNSTELIPLLAATALGLAIGIERERSPAHRARRIGARTFPLLALAGAIGALVGPVAQAVTVAVCGAAILTWYWRITDAARTADGADDVGITTMAAAIVTVLLGALAVDDAALAVALAVVVVVLLAAKHRLHDFARHAMDDRDVTDAITLLVVAFLVLPLMPDRTFGPYGSLNLRTIWLLVVFLTGIGWAGYVTTRILGRRWGLFVTALAGGFVSGTASTAVAARAAQANADARRDALGAAVAVNISTLVQAVVVTWFIDSEVARAVLIGAVAGIAVLVLEVAVLLLRSTHGGVRPPDAEMNSTFGGRDYGRPMSVWAATSLAVVLALLLMATRAAAHQFGGAGVLVVSAIGGLADAHAAAIAAASTASAGFIGVGTATLAIGVGLLTNLGVKLTLAGSLGGTRFVFMLVGLHLPVIAAVGRGLFWAVITV